MSDILVQRHRSFDEIPASEWEMLRESSSLTTIFQSRGWNECWWQSKGTNRERLLLLSARKEGRLVGIAPLYVHPRAWALGRTAVCFIGRGNADYCDFIIEAGETAVANELLEAARNIPETWVAMHLENLLDGGSAAQALYRRPFAKLQLLGTCPCPAVIRRPGERTFEELTKKKMLRQNTKLLSRAGRVDTTHLTEADRILPHLEDFFSQHIRRWDSTSSPSLFLDPANRAFYASLVDRLAPEGHILFSLVSLNGRPVAYHFGFIEQPTLYYYKPTYEPEFARLSPGTTLLASLFSYCEERGLAKFDFMRGNEPYKAHYANWTERTWSYVVHRRRVGLYASLAAQHMRSSVRRLVRNP
jgi:CelD/BcsL family acetyltransferase involved in cellulose biosynthesis